MRNWRLISILLVFCLTGVQITFAQDPIVHFKSGDKVLSENINSFINDPGILSEEKIDGYFYRYMQFEAIPDLTDQERLKSSGIKLIEYLPDNTYLVAIPIDYNLNQLSNYKIRSVVKTDIEDKLDQRFLDQSWPDWADDGNNLKVILKAYEHTSRNTFLNLLRSRSIQFSKSDVHFPFVYTLISKSEILSIAGLPFIQYMDFGPDPGEKEDTGGRTLQRANLINSEIPGGLRYDATGVNIMVRDDGVVGPHIDFEGRLVDLTGGVDGSQQHADGVAGVFAGAGNLDPTVEGGASGATIYVTNYQAEFTDNTVALHQSDNVVITNSSYSNGCNAGYTATTQRVDQQMVDNPSLMHVFSAGNSNNNECGYGAGTQWGNITGGHKQGKNVMAVANLFADGSLASSSSRGPAHDGRLKPDISAHGQDQISTDPNNQYQTFGGTSAAAPTMAGSLAQLYQVYKDLNGGADPNAGFMKAVILNSAFDKGNVGPDYKFGWGRIDAGQAYETLINNYYTNGNVTQGDRNNHNIVVPADVEEFRVMVYWTDPAGAINTSKALVNDINIWVNDPNPTRHNPWELDPTPNPANLDLPASRGSDDLNNMEQVVIDSPVAGTYKLKVDGGTIPMGVQEYNVAWTFFYDAYKVTYPNGGEGFVPGETERIHWNAPASTTSNFILEYSVDNGANWINIASGISSTTRLFNWTVPNNVTSEARVRIRGGGKNDRSDQTFSIIELPDNLRVTSSCKTGATFEWNSVTGADEYNVYKLGEKYMEMVTTTNSLSHEFNDLETGSTAWFSVQAINDDGVVGRRANAISHFVNPAAINCRNTVNFEKTASVSEAEAGDTVDYTLTFTSFYDDPITNIELTDVLDPTWTYIDGTLTCGTIMGNTITINQANLNPDNSIVCTFSIRSDPFNETTEVFNDDMESGTSLWTINNSRGSTSWDQTTANSNSPSTSWFTENSGVESNTQSITSTSFILGDDAELSFYHFYNTESGWDGGMVEISTDGGNNWNDLGNAMIQNGYNGGLGNGGNPDIGSRSAFTGNSGGFIQTIVDLSAYANMSVKIRFLFGEDDNTNVEGWYVDDVLVQNTFYKTNMACATFDQGAEICSSVSTLMLPCLDFCANCEDGMQNGSETGVDCGGEWCAPCPCTDLGIIVYDNMEIPDPTFERTNQRIELTGDVTTGDDSQVELFTGTRFDVYDTFETGENATFSVTIEDCDED